MQAARKEDVLNALSQVASKFRSRVGESLTTVVKHDTPLREATTPSLEPLKAYSAGWKVLISTGSAAAIPFFKRAIEIDPKFATAYASLGRMYGDIGESVLSAENTRKAYELRDHASDQEKFLISASYDTQVTGNLARAEQTCELWVQAYPRAWTPHGFLGGLIYSPLGKYEKSVEEAKIGIGFQPDSPVAYSILATGYLSLERTNEAEDTLRRASERDLHRPELDMLQYSVAFLKDDKVGMKREEAQARGKTGLEDRMADSEARAFAYSGQLEEARKMSRQAADLARQVSERETEASYESEAALWEALFGDASAARQATTAALGLSKSRDVEYAVAFAEALSGDSSGAQRLTDDISQRFPEDTIVEFTYKPTLSALLALSHNQPSKAVELLQVAVPYELGTGSLYPAYLRGEAYLAARQGQEAAIEFQKILDHRGIVLSDPIGALAHLQLGRAYSLAGNSAKAKAAYQDFLTLWEDADPDIPILNQAKAEYANLQ